MAVWATDSRGKLNADFQHKSDYSKLGARVEMCIKHLCLPRISSAELSFEAFSNTQAAKSGASNVELAGLIEETTMRCMNLSTLLISSTQRASFNSLVDKNEMVIAQPKAKRLETERRRLDPSTGQIVSGFLVGSKPAQAMAPARMLSSPPQELEAVPLVGKLSIHPNPSCPAVMWHRSNSTPTVPACR